MQELSDLWRVTSDAVNISKDFSPREFAAALHHLKPGKAPGPDSISLELLIHAGSGLKLWLRGFLSSCLCHSKLQKYREEHWESQSLKTCRRPTELLSPLSALRLLQDPQTTDLQLSRTNSRPYASKGTGWSLTRKVYRRSGSFAYAKH